VWTAEVPSHGGRAQRARDDVPDRSENGKPGGHPCDQAQRHLHDAVPQLTDVIHERHAALRVLLPP
jgi:hypothetical protein